MYKGQLKDFPREVVEKMLERQVEQGNVRNVKVFEKKAKTSISNGGFDWEKANEGYVFWYSVINDKRFDVFFAKYPQTAEGETTPKISNDLTNPIDTKEAEKINQEKAKDSEIASLKKQLETSEELYRVLEQRYDESLELCDELQKECDELKQRIETIDKELDKMIDSKATAWSLYHAECAKVSQLQAELTAIKVIVNKF